MSLGVMLCRFRDLFLSVIARHGVSVDVISGMRHAQSLGFGQLGGVSVSRQCSLPLRTMSWCLSMSRQLHTLESKLEQSPLHRSLRHGTNCVFFQQIRFEFRLIRKFGYAPLNKIPKAREANGESG